MIPTTTADTPVTIGTDVRPTATPRKPRRMAREPGTSGSSAPDKRAASQRPRGPSKLDQMEALLLAPGGASIAEIMAISGWQQHSVRGAMAGALKKRGLVITSEKVDRVRRYRAEQPA